MTELSQPPDISRLEIPVDPWTQPFWDATARGELRLPRCASCQIFRWPPGPFCPECQSQAVDWAAAGRALLYSFTIVRQRDLSDDGPGRLVIPGLVEFPDAGGIRIMAAILARAEAVAIGARLVLGWTPHGDMKVPVFTLDREP
ncbi:zinc ribbon domain-containing protein [Novosphingobium sp. PS1R-30]|uniref:Zinc ribbon domain-containing protein n=1 Tax=Novosphingobium anseongense TaxID=3133436 RepID=A0ABU8S2D7_9SPHN